MWAYLKKERLPRGHTKLYMRNIVPYKILHKFGENAYEILLPPAISISPIFNVCDLTPFKGDARSNHYMLDANEIQIEWIKYLPPSQPLQLEKILDSKVVK